LFGGRAIENRLSGEENAGTINYMTFQCRTKLLTARVADHPRGIFEQRELVPYASTGSFAILTWPSL
jgi:hypothetical protein